jgi:conjugative transfer region protein TrbK
MDHKMLARTIIVAALGGLLVTTIGVLHRRNVDGQSEGTIPSTFQTDDLSAELRRCGKLGPQDAAEDPRCQAVWEENRRRFFGYGPHVFPVVPDRSASAVPGASRSPSTVSPRGSAPSLSTTGAPQP